MTRSGGTSMLLRTVASESAFVSLGVTCGFLPAFWVLAWLSACESPVYRWAPPRPNGERLDPP